MCVLVKIVAISLFIQVIENLKDLYLSQSSFSPLTTSLLLPSTLVGERENNIAALVVMNEFLIGELRSTSTIDLNVLRPKIRVKLCAAKYIGQACLSPCGCYICAGVN